MKAVTQLGERIVESEDGDANNVRIFGEGFNVASVRNVNGELALVRHPLPESTPGVARDEDGLIRIYDP